MHDETEIQQNDQTPTPESKPMSIQEQAEDMLVKWQARLKMSHWDIVVNVVRMDDMNRTSNGCVTYHDARQALIEVLDPIDNDGSWPFPYNLEREIAIQLIALLFRDANEDSTLSRAQKQAAFAIATALVDLSREQQGGGEEEEEKEEEEEPKATEPEFKIGDRVRRVYGDVLRIGTVVDDPCAGSVPSYLCWVQWENKVGLELCMSESLSYYVEAKPAKLKFKTGDRVRTFIGTPGTVVEATQEYATIKWDKTEITTTVYASELWVFEPEPEPKPEPTPEFKIGDKVYYKGDPGNTGIVERIDHTPLCLVHVAWNHPRGGTPVSPENLVLIEDDEEPKPIRAFKMGDRVRDKYMLNAEGFVVSVPPVKTGEDPGLIMVQWDYAPQMVRNEQPKNLVLVEEEA